MISERAYAKVNLGLDVLGRREDGYHLVRLVMQTIDLYDSLTLEQCPEAEGEISLSIVPGDAGFGSDGEQGNVSFEPNGEAGDAVFEPNGEAGDAVFGSNGEARDAVFESGHATGAGALDVSALPTDDRNLCVRAARALLEDAGRSDGIRIELVKRIPFEAGLGGGSTDAAAVLRGVNELLHLDYTNEKLAEIGLKIGADVPYLVYGGCFLAEGIGERLTRVDSRAKEVSLLLVKPDFGAGTGGIYGAFDALPDPFHPDIDGLIGALRGGRIEEVAARMGNALQAVTGKDHPEIAYIIEEIKKAGALSAIMTGSGPTVFGLFSEEAACRKAARKIAGAQPHWFVRPTRFYPS